jgi:hypothetical protein
MPGTLPDILTDRPSNQGPPPPTNQVYSNPMNPNNPFDQRDFPNTEYVKQHRVAFDNAMGTQETDPPYWYGLPEGRYQGLMNSEHQGRRPIWQLTQGGKMVANAADLIAALVPGDGMDLIPGSVYHSHWAGLKGGAISQVVIVNTGEGASKPGEGGRAICLDAEMIGEMLALPVFDEKRIAWLKGIRDGLTHPV